MGSWVTALSAQASDMSGWLLMGLPGAIYLAGMNQIWIAVGLIIGTFLNWFFVAARLRPHVCILQRPPPFVSAASAAQSEVGLYIRVAAQDLILAMLVLRNRRLCCDLGAFAYLLEIVFTAFRATSRHHVLER